MTSLTGLAASFFSGGCGLFGCQKGQSGPKNVARCVLVGVGGVFARDASEDCLGDAVLWCCMPTCFAAVRGVPGIHVKHSPPSFFRFGFEDADEGRPTRVVNGTVERRLACASVGKEFASVGRMRDRLGSSGHISNAEVFDHDHVVQGHQFSSCLVVEVSPLICDLSVPSRDSLAGGSAVVRASLLTRQGLLRFRQPGLTGAGPTRVSGVLTITGGGETVNAQVHTNGKSGPLHRFGWHIVAAQDQVPATSLALYLDRFHAPFLLAVDGRLHIPHPLQIHTVRVGFPPTPVPILWPLHAFEPMLGLKPGVARVLARPEPTKETFKSFVKSPQRCLLRRKRPNCHVRTQRTYFGQLAGLRAITHWHLRPNRAEVAGRAFNRPFVGAAALLECGVVQLPVRVKTFSKLEVLTSGRAQSKLVRAPHAPPTPRRIRESSMSLETLRLGCDSFGEARARDPREVN